MTGMPVKLGEPVKVPQELALQAEPLADQETPFGSVVVAVRERVCVMVRPARLGEIEILIAPEETRIEAVPVLELSAMEVAVRVTLEFAGGGAGGAV